MKSCRVSGLIVLSVVTIAGAHGCDDSKTDTPSAPAPPRIPTPLPALTDAPTTRDVTLVPRTPRVASIGENPSDPVALADYLSRGFGELDQGPGEPYVVRSIDDTKPPAPGPNAKRLVRFAHLADMQIADDESPARLASFDGTAVTSGAARPQDAYLCRMANGAVRTINALHAKDPLAFTLMGGDNADNAQTNEVDWVLGVLSGADAVECDSGADDDLVPGLDNDGKDPFKADGLRMPWKWVTGNHDVLVQGNLPVDDVSRERALGTDASGGTRRYGSSGNGIIERSDTVVADARRALLSGKELMAKVGAHADGHGIDAPSIASGHATYAFDVAGSPLRVVVIDTAYENGGAQGVMRQSEIDRAIKPLLDRAKADGRWVILASHHAAQALGDGSDFGSSKSAPDALTTDQWTSFLGQYDNVVFSMVGHNHRHRAMPIKPAKGHAYWEVMTAAIADWPHQFRVLEIFDQDDGWLMMRAACVDFARDGDPVAAEGKRRGVVDFTAGWIGGGNEPTASDRNVELWIKKPGS